MEFFSVHNPKFHLNDREYRIFELRDSLASVRAFNMQGAWPVEDWEKELNQLIQQRMTDIPTSRPHREEKQKRIADRKFAFSE